MKILIADDHEPTRTYLKESLKNSGHEISECADGHEVIARIFSGQIPDIIILDWMMPAVSGIEVIKKIRSEARLNHIYIMMLTSRTEREDIISAIRAGANDYICKPIYFEELRSRLRAATQLVQMSEQIANQRLKMITYSRFAMLGQLGSNVVNEIIEPIAALKSYVPTIEDPVFSMALQKLESLVASLRVIAGKNEKQASDEVRIASLVQELVSLQRSRCESHGIELRLPAIEPEIMISGLREDLLQVLLILIGRAIDAIKDRSVKWIDIAAIHDSKTVFIAVTDSSPSEVTGQELERVLLPSTQPSEGSTFLSLGVAKAIINQHDGELYLDRNSPTTRYVISLSRDNRFSDPRPDFRG